MAIIFTTDVFCDGLGCGQWIFGTTGCSITGSRKTAREQAKKAGWIRKDGKDYCPKCAKKVR